MKKINLSSGGTNYILYYFETRCYIESGYYTGRNLKDQYIEYIKILYENNKDRIRYTMV